MLLELSVRDVALVEGVDLTFAPGFNVLTGETGAGKSLIVDAIALALGGRAGPELVRAGAERARVLAELAGDPGLVVVGQERRHLPGRIAGADLSGDADEGCSVAEPEGADQPGRDALGGGNARTSSLPDALRGS